VWTENFFSYFNSIFPILSRPQFTTQLEKNELNPVLKLSVFLLGCRLNNNSNNLNDEKMLFQQLSYLLSKSHDTIHDISTVQATIIMCWYTHLAGDNRKCTSLRHSLATLIQKLDLGYESNKLQDIHDAEMKRRAFWVSYVIDQWLAICTGSERYLTDLEVTCRYPQLEDNQLFAFLYDDYIAMSNLESNLTEWLLQLPSYLDYGKQLNNDVSPSPVAKIYRILYYTAQIIMNKHKCNNNQGLSASICASAANSIFHISDQMLELEQEKYLYNVFFLSLTLATSTHLDNTLFNQENNTPNMINLCKSVSQIKRLNCSALLTFDFNQLMDHFLADRTFIFFNSVYPSPTNSSYNSNLPDWIVSFDQNAFEASNTCSPASYFTPTHSPSITFNMKDEDNLTFNLLTTDQQFFSHFNSI
ncbi:MAG: fungal-specific transcription factor domain-containing protein, partial [Benjaminiella poitrasii]